jgi:hypothetical protein
MTIPILDDPEQLDIDLRRANVTATCPFCGGRYVSGWRRSKPTNVLLVHSMPQCETFAAMCGKGLEFLKAAVKAGARPQRIA